MYSLELQLDIGNGSQLWFLDALRWSALQDSIRILYSVQRHSTRPIPSLTIARSTESCRSPSHAGLSMSHVDWGQRMAACDCWSLPCSSPL
jgi:hypothetical protein